MSEQPAESVPQKGTKFNDIPPQAYLKECFDYDPDTGILRWKHRPTHHFKADWICRSFNTRYGGTEAGAVLRKTPRPDGHVRNELIVMIHFAGSAKSYVTARIIYQLLHGGLTPEDRIDHRDLNPMNNRPANLRLSTHQMNTFNISRKSFKGKHRDLPKGVYPNGKNKWQAKIKFNYKNECLGTYSSPELASEAYMKRAKELAGEFARQD